jgi:hypothetical protein
MNSSRSQAIALGLTPYAFDRLRKCATRVNEWDESLLSGRVQYHNDIPHHYKKDRHGSYTIDDGPCPNRLKIALDDAIRTAGRFDLKIYHQTDPRGHSLYVYSAEDLIGCKYPIEQVYKNRAVPIPNKP